DATAHSVNGSAVYLPRPIGGLVLELDVTAAAAASGDTLDCAVQTLIDQSNWVDVARFTLVLGNAGAKRYYACLTLAGGCAMFEAASSLSAGSLRHIFGDAWRCRYTITDGGAHGQSFTFSMTACPF